jgi:3-oxoacyl-[acyl-carrier-protein] synthase III
MDYRHHTDHRRRFHRTVTGAVIRAIEYYLPEGVLSSEDLSSEFPDWPVEKIEGKTGIRARRIAARNECSSDLGIAAAKKLFESGIISASEIDYLLFCTQSPDYFLPTTACLVQEALGISVQAGALDFNLGCSGYVYGLGLAKGLVESGQASNVLLITSETYSKFINPRDRSVRTLFGDAAAATLVQAQPDSERFLGPFVFGTDGKGARNLIVPAGGMRCRTNSGAAPESGEPWRTAGDLYMNGAELFSFTMREVPACVQRLLDKSASAIPDYDLFVFHQANRYMLDHLRKGMKIPEEKFCIAMADCGNTVSSTIPIALKDASLSGKLKSGDRVMLVGFGVGYSWGAASVRWI